MQTIHGADLNYTMVEVVAFYRMDMVPISTTRWWWLPARQKTGIIAILTSRWWWLLARQALL